ncbi:hypothetical protein BGX31_002040, partial [Mortierella sp. GBA43]
MNAIFTKMVLKTNKDGNVATKMEVRQSAGGTTFKALPSTRVFLSKSSIDAARNHSGTRFSDSPFPPLAHLRCTFSHFGHVSAYYSARAGHAGDLGEMPATLFTLPNFDLFAKIATAMMTDPNTAVLKMEDVEKLGETTAMRREIRQSLLNLFKVKDKKDKIKDKKDKVKDKEVK